MLAPRKKLWSTPKSVIDKIRTLLSPLQASDIFYDVGCGDGRVLIHLAKTTPCRNFVGIEIDQDRANEARRAVYSARLDPSINVEIRCENALESDYADATIVFLYLIPRGLRLIKPVLLRGRTTVIALNENVIASVPQNEQNYKKSALHTKEEDIESIGNIMNSKQQPQSQESTALVGENELKQLPVLSPDHDTTLAVSVEPKLRVATYMAGWSDVQHVAKEMCTVEHQKGAKWPVYLYHFY